MYTQAILSLPLLATLAAAHGVVTNIRMDGVDYPGWSPFNDPYKTPKPQVIVRAMKDNGPVEDVSSLAILCNSNGDTSNVPVNKQGIVTAGSDVTFSWTEWPSSHKGPVMTYMANCNGDCSTFSGANSPVWFKIQHEGLNADGSWAADKIVSTGKWTTKIPAELAPGQYLLRHEILALHSAQNTNGAQFYPMCAQITLQSNGNQIPTDLVSFPGAYKNNDPGVLFNMYYPTPTSYTIPGPAVWKAGTGTTAGSQSSQPATPSSSPTVAPPSSSSQASNCASPVGAWGQCGGKNFAGSTCCATGNTCIVVNEWYWQCQPGQATPTSTSSSIKASSSSFSTQAPASSSSTCPAASVTVSTVTVTASATSSAGPCRAYNRCVALAALNAGDSTPVDVGGCAAQRQGCSNPVRRHFKPTARM